MATAKRFSYSVLISTLAFAVFAVFAFSGLFPWIEAQFYSPKVVSDLQTELDSAAMVLEAWQQHHLERVTKLLSDPAFDGVFGPTASQEALQKRFQSTKLFLLGVRGGGSLRILNNDRSQVHFSSEDSDVKARTDFSVTYRPVAEIAGFPSVVEASLADEKVHLLSDPSSQMIFFLYPWRNPKNEVIGYALLGASPEDLRLSLLEAGVPFSQQAPIPLGATDYLVSLLGRAPDPDVVRRVQDLWRQGVLPPVQRLGTANGTVSVSVVHKGHLSVLVPSSTLELNEILKYLLLASFYTVLFLVVYLLANLRGEPLSIVTRKVKRFQLQVVKQYLDLKEQDKIQSLRDELAQHSDEIRSDVRRSLGRIRKKDQEWVDRYIDTSWQEVMDLLRGPAPPVESASNADWKRLETLLQQALTQGRFVVSPSPQESVQPSKPARSTVVVPKKAPPVSAVEEVEEAEAVDELEEVEEAEAVDGLEEVEEAEAVDELEEVEEAEAVDELEEVEEAEAVDELEEVEEAEAVDELEEVEEAEAVGEPRMSEELEEELEVVEDLEELDDAEASEQEEAGDDSLEELPPRSPPMDFSALRRVPTSEGVPVSVLNPVPDDSLEELDELEEVLDDLDTEPVQEDLSIPLERLDTAWGLGTQNYFEESGDVVQLRDDVFSEAGEANDELGHLVGEVLAGPDFDAFEPLEEDLVPQQMVREWRWTGGGFDWDKFALGSDEVNLFRALSEIVTQLDGFTAAILTEASGTWTAQSSVGFSDSGKDLLRYGSESPLAKAFLSIRALHVLKGGQAHPVLRASFHPKDMKFLKSVLCVPLLFRHQPAWLLLGLRHDPGDILELLAPRRFE